MVPFEGGAAVARTRKLRRHVQAHSFPRFGSGKFLSFSFSPTLQRDAVVCLSNSTVQAVII